MKRSFVSPVFVVACIAVVVGQVYADDVYKQELLALKTSSQGKYIFDKKVDSALATLNRDIENRKELSFLQRVVRFPFMRSDAVVVTPETMPKLYDYVDSLCKKHTVATPTIFISTKKSIFNAFAAKLFASTGGILICQRLLLETSDSELEAVVAHEIGHIKYNHVNKTLLLNMGTFIATPVIIHYALKKGLLKPTQTNITLVQMAHWFAIMCLPDLIINKRFEKQADEFACKEVGAAAGLIEFFEHIEAKELNAEKECADACEHTAAALQAHKHRLGIIDRVDLSLDFQLIKLRLAMRHSFIKWYKWVYHNTFIGAHPSPQARIAAAKKYLPIEQ